jgi:hypothetical protein
MENSDRQQVTVHLFSIPSALHEKAIHFFNWQLTAYQILIANKSWLNCDGWFHVDLLALEQ